MLTPNRVKKSKPNTDLPLVTIPVINGLPWDKGRAYAITCK